MHKLAVIGDKSSVYAFRALGAEVFSPAEDGELRNTVDHLARKGYAVIYITERFAERIPETIARYETEATPAIILIPDSRGSLGIGMKKISENVEKAVGMDIF
ncbi:V-type ATP synthase subunit F [Peptoniphilaceae bacterium SGI.137]|nr:V-type ATP synthase subunit F [Peptoniphilaceae bacterium]MCI6660490.1 V-type ATP synthase subunit F [Peptoniphilaceae bacterium]MDY3987490.1 V-type ATP synthase subunit F [Peptoniphilaceae bacterium]MDY4196477.1 V-type ATP synthase subunit F [Peptoniphilaceae bacterium]MDY5841599.1 V-type ATP synthase subunit F [Peptoniphilaceae bacterium]